MRTTLTLDPDVAAALEAMRKKRRLSLKEAVNQALRTGLRPPHKVSTKSRPFRTRKVDHGRPLIGSLDDIAGVLSVVEDDELK